MSSSAKDPLSPAADSNIIVSQIEKEKFDLEDDLTIRNTMAIAIGRLPIETPQEEFRTYLTKDLELKPLKIHFYPEWNRKQPRLAALLYYPNEESLFQALKIVDKAHWRKKSFTRWIEVKSERLLYRRELLEEYCHSRVYDKSTEEEYNLLTKTKTIPYWNIPYFAQLKTKQRAMYKVLRKACKSMYNIADEPLCDWLKDQEKLYNRLPCELLPIRATDAIKEYRNKCEFSIGKDRYGNRTMIGFTVVRLKEVSPRQYLPVGPVDDLIHIPQNMKDVVKVLEEYVEECKVEPYNAWNTSGCWSTVTMRTNIVRDLMVIMSLEPRNMQKEKIEELKTRLKHCFDEGKGAYTNLTSLYLQTVYPKQTGGLSRNELFHLTGETHLEETLCGMNFRISPEAFFQVNTKGAELLYETALELAEVDMDTTVLDICCGTGTIGIFFSKHCGEVLGVESVEQAIKDAKENAQKNGADNCEFFHGKAEDLLGAMIRRATKSKIVAIVDPPRAGLHQRAVHTLRNQQKISRLIYISCDPEAALKNVVDLARPTSKAYRGDRFVPVKAIPIDMFPHTKHCELVVCLERFSDAKNRTSAEIERLQSSDNTECDQQSRSPQEEQRSSDDATVLKRARSRSPMETEESKLSEACDCPSQDSTIDLSSD